MFFISKRKTKPRAVALNSQKSFTGFACNSMFFYGLNHINSQSSVFTYGRNMLNVVCIRICAIIQDYQRNIHSLQQRKLQHQLAYQCKRYSPYSILDSPQNYGHVLGHVIYELNQCSNLSKLYQVPQVPIFVWFVYIIFTLNRNDLFAPVSGSDRLICRLDSINNISIFVLVI